jgi:transcriptional regulator with XRE-family HTH domain
MIDSNSKLSSTPPSSEYAGAARRLGRRLRYLRGQLGVTQQEVARNIGTHRTYISRLERGRIMPRLSSLVRLASYLQLDVTELVGGLSAPTCESPKKISQTNVPVDATS